MTGALPASVLLHVDYDGGAAAKNSRQLALCELWSEPQMQAFVKPALEVLNGIRRILRLYPAPM